ncbi:hypothetical protein C8R41DRAFT_836591 [Lentinula lateritia]|uniref:Uncharacterized protein n=1 Tax=Lentinula lateritia TaxID=40482 RepID=A0ABQ8VD10_9AGAR|nr:hypothetical protein C8R41DRAFT_836591 [Lentinula lateritia]
MEVQGQVGDHTLAVGFPTGSAFLLGRQLPKSRSEAHLKRSNFHSFSPSSSHFPNTALVVVFRSDIHTILRKILLTLVETSMQSRLSGMNLYLKICFITILSVACVVVLPVSGSELVHRADQAGPANQQHDLGDRHIPWKIMITFFFPLEMTPEASSVLAHREGIAASIHNEIAANTDIATRYRISTLKQIPSLLPPGISYEGDVSLRLTWNGPNHVFESRGKITANGGISEVNTIDVEISFPAGDAGIGIRMPGVPEEIAFTVPVYRT